MELKLPAAASAKAGRAERNVSGEAAKPALKESSATLSMR